MIEDCNLQEDRSGLQRLHVDTVTIDLDTIPAEGSPHPHGLGLLQQGHDHLVDGAGPDDLAGQDEVGGRPSVLVLCPEIIFSSCRNLKKHRIVNIIT